jgi:ribosomal-protein-alanine N-acetyltransferase
MKPWLERGGTAVSAAAGSRLRKAELPAAPAMAQLHATAFHRGWGVDEIESLLLDESVMAHVLAPKAKLAGFALSRRAADEAEILSIVVERSARGRGLGRELLRGHLDALREAGTFRVFLEVDEQNAAARALYIDEDFAEVGRRANYYQAAAGARSAALVFCRELRPRLTDEACQGF